MVGFHLYKISTKGKSTVTERRLVVASGEGHKGMGSDSNRCGVSFWGDENVLKLTMVMVVQPFKHTKNHRIIHSKRVDYISIKLLLNKLAANPHSNTKRRFSSSL